MRSAARALYASAILATITTVAAACPATASPVLNYPTGDSTAQHAIFKGIRAGINAATPGSELRLLNPAMSWAVERPLVRAADRGVKVRVIMAGHAPGYPGLTPAGQALADQLGYDTSASSWVRVCAHSCNAPSRGIMHAKMLLTSAPRLTLLTSVDLLSPLSASEFDQAYRTTAPDVYRHEKHWFATLVDQRAQSFPRDLHGNGLVLSNFPRPESTPEDNWYSQALTPIQCQDARGKSTDTSVWLLTSLWSPMLTPLAHQVVQKSQDGCDVRVILNKLRTPREIVQILTDGGVPFRYSNTGRYHSHVKEIAVRGVYGGRRISTVLSGTLNPSISEMRYCDEAMVRVTSPSVYDAFVRQAGEIWKLGGTAPLPRDRKVRVTR
jgi:PLD-like domain